MHIAVIRALACDTLTAWGVWGRQYPSKECWVNTPPGLRSADSTCDLTFWQLAVNKWPTERRQESTVELEVAPKRTA